MKNVTPLRTMALVILLIGLVAVSMTANVLLWTKLQAEQSANRDLSRQVFTLQSQASPALADFRRNLSR